MPDLLPLWFFLAALLYSSIGHGGASAYLAVMALAGVVPEMMRPAALVMNVAVAGVALLQFARQGAFSWKLFLPFAMVSVPCAWLGGLVKLPAGVHQIAIACALAFAAFRLWLISKPAPGKELRPLNYPIAFGTGGALGFLAGLTGIGGGIFLSPVIILARWADSKTTAGISAAFILVNSIAGIAALKPAAIRFPENYWLWFAAVVIGGLAGSIIGSRKLSVVLLQRVLALVLAVAAVKLIKL